MSYVIHIFGIEIGNSIVCFGNFLLSNNYPQQYRTNKNSFLLIFSQARKINSTSENNHNKISCKISCISLLILQLSLYKNYERLP